MKSALSACQTSTWSHILERWITNSIIIPVCLIEFNHPAICLMLSDGGCCGCGNKTTTLLLTKLIGCHYKPSQIYTMDRRRISLRTPNQTLQIPLEYHSKLLNMRSYRLVVFFRLGLLAFEKWISSILRSGLSLTHSLCTSYSGCCTKPNQFIPCCTTWCVFRAGSAQRNLQLVRYRRHEGDRVRMKTFCLNCTATVTAYFATKMPPCLIT